LLGIGWDQMPGQHRGVADSSSAAETQNLNTTSPRDKFSFMFPPRTCNEPFKLRLTLLHLYETLYLLIKGEALGKKNLQKSDKSYSQAITDLTTGGPGHRRPRTHRVTGCLSGAGRMFPQ
jgi:hypothetical protein